MRIENLAALCFLALWIGLVPGCSQLGDDDSADDDDSAADDDDSAGP